MSSLLDSLISPQPKILAVDAQRMIEAYYDLTGALTSVGGERDQNFLLRTNAGDYLLKISNSAEPEKLLEFQNAALRHIRAKDPILSVQNLVKTTDGKDWARVKGPDDQWYRARVFEYLPGLILKNAPQDMSLMRNLGQTLARLDLALGGFSHSAADHLLAWDLKRLSQLTHLCSFIPDASDRSLVGGAFDGFQQIVSPELPSLRTQVIHNDVSFHNAVVDPEDPTVVSGIFDFGDMIHSPLIQELAVTASEVPTVRDDPIASCVEIVAGYNTVIRLEPKEFELLPHLICARLALGIAIHHWSDAGSGVEPEREYLTGWPQESVRTLDILSNLGATEMTKILRERCERDDSLWNRRLHSLGNAGVVAYDQPLHLVRGEGVWLYDHAGHAYLDVYNNVPHVGHGHPHVVAAIANQAATLNTNTRYVYDSVLDYAERLTATLPPGLEVCFFVSSGSEANDLAWRIAKAVTGNAGAIVMENAYHGITDATFALSPEEWPEHWRKDPAICPHIETLTAPNDYRGRWRRDVEDRGERYAALSTMSLEKLKSKGYAPAAFFMDMIMSSSGIFPPPAGYLQGVFARVRDAGGLCVADEVQSGFGRLGRHMWGFQMDHVVPDIVTFGKPIANGFPMGLVVTTRAIADRFEQHSEFFSTTGGNPVACAAASAVLDVIEDRNLVDHADAVGAALMNDIRGLAQRHEVIGDVRGSGLFIGVELVNDKETMDPAGEKTHKVVNLLRDQGVLVGSVGTGSDPPGHGNILKLRPPMVFDAQHGSTLMKTLDNVLSSL